MSAGRAQGPRLWARLTGGLGRSLGEEVEDWEQLEEEDEVFCLDDLDVDDPMSGAKAIGGRSRVPTSQTG